MSFTTAALLVSWLAILVLALGLAGLMRQIAEVGAQQALGGARPRTGSLVGLSLPTTGPLSTLRPAGGGVLLVVAPGCSSCQQSVEALLSAGLGPHTVAVSAAGCEYRGLQACIPDAREAIERLGVPATPYLVAVDADGVIRRTEVPDGVEDVAAFSRDVAPLVRPQLGIRMTTRHDDE